MHTSLQTFLLAAEITVSDSICIDMMSLQAIWFNVSIMVVLVVCIVPLLAQNGQWQ